MGPPPEPGPIAQAREIFVTLRPRDGKYAEAIAAVMWHCGLCASEAEEAIKDIPRGAHNS